MKAPLIRLGLILIPVCLCLQAPGETVYVDGNHGSVGTGAKESPYQTINQALANPSADTIVVMPGVYTEQLRIERSLTLRSYDGPAATVIDGSRVALMQWVVGITVTNLTVVLEGFRIDGGEWGVAQGDSTNLTLSNCVISNARKSGVIVYRSACGARTLLQTLNCIFVANGGSGIAMNYPSNNCPPWVTCIGCIMMDNERYGVEFDEPYPYAPIVEPNGFRDHLFFDYNITNGNALGGYGIHFGTRGSPGVYVAVGSGSSTLRPNFVSTNPASLDFRLLPGSSGIDGGHPGVGFLDPDGTRNDIGAFGGPGARTFYTNPNDGPMVREVTVDKSIVHKGDTFTIRAKAAAR